MFKRALVSSLVAVTIAAGAVAGTVQPSAAHGFHHYDQGAVALIPGFGGSIVGTSLVEQPRTSYFDPNHWPAPRCLYRDTGLEPNADRYFGYRGPLNDCRL